MEIYPSRNINLPFLKVKKKIKPTRHRSLTFLATVSSPLSYGAKRQTPREPKIGFLSFSDKLTSGARGFSCAVSKKKPARVLGLRLAFGQRTSRPRRRSSSSHARKKTSGTQGKINYVNNYSLSRDISNNFASSKLQLNDIPERRKTLILRAPPLSPFELISVLLIRIRQKLKTREVTKSCIKAIFHISNDL